MEDISTLAEEWTRGLPRGWRQVQAIADRLRLGYELDRRAKPPEDCEFPVHHFLFESRRGPDYLFATAAAMMLRSIDCPHESSADSTSILTSMTRSVGTHRSRRTMSISGAKSLSPVTYG